MVDELAFAVDWQRWRPGDSQHGIWAFKEPLPRTGPQLRGKNLIVAVRDAFGRQQRKEQGKERIGGIC